MVIFSEEFGSDDPFVDALQTARWMAERDFLAFCPHMGIASGLVAVGYVGTPLKYSCSVFGVPVSLAKRCSSVEPSKSSQTSIIFPADLWGDRSFEETFPPRKIKMPDGKIIEDPPPWELLPPRKVKIKNIPEVEIMEVSKLTIHAPMQSAVKRAQDSLRILEKHGLYRPWRPKETKSDENKQSSQP